MPDPSEPPESSRPALPETGPHLPRTPRAAVRPDDITAELQSAFGDRYQIGDKLGQGGFGSVYRGFDRRLNRPVAIKAARTDISPLADAERLTAEARRVAQLRHPGIVSVFDVGVGGHRCFIVAELLTGPNLAVWLQDYRPGWSEAVGIAAGVADALDHAHTRGVVHRDVKPANIILIDGGRPVLVDFGIALSDGVPADELSLVAGTPAYMSPEQARGLSYRPDGRTDVYSLGATLYEMLAGRAPFDSTETQALLRMLRDHDPPPLRQVRPEIPAAVAAVVAKAMAKTAAERYSTAAEFALALRMLTSSTVEFARSADTKFVESPDDTRTPTLIPSPAERDTPSRFERPTNRPTPSVRRTDAERRPVTLLHATLELTEIDEPDLDASHEHYLAFHESCRSVAASCGGFVVPAAGTSVLAGFGYPQAQEDAPRHAVKAGLQIAARARPGAIVRVGIHTGLAVISESADGALSIVGDVANVVARLESLLESSGVAISESAHRLASGYFECEPAGELRTRGSSAPLAVYRVLSEGAARNRLDASDPARLTPLVGRDREIGLLRERWDLATEGIGHVVLLIAEPGLGKSRLVRTIRDYAQQSSRAAVIDWSCSSQHRNSPLHPALDYFERAFGLDRAADADRKLDRLITGLRASGCDQPERVAALAAALGIPSGGRLPELNLSPERLRERIRDALLDWLRRCSANEPVLFTVEDLHWVDPTTEEVLAAFVESCEAAALLAVFTTRPEFDPPWKGKTHQTQIALTRLTRRQVGDLIRAQFGRDDVPAAAIDRIAERTDGVPLFVEEFARLHAESGTSLEGTIPPTLHDLLLARLDRAAGDKDVVQAAAALGRAFDVAVLRAVTGQAEPTLRAELDRLVAAGILTAKGTPPDSYAFKHALIQDAAYHAMVKPRRQQVHRAIAEVLAARATPAARVEPEVLAHHCTEAGLAAEAVDHWLAAGTQARERSAHAEAIRHLNRGLELLLTLPASPHRDERELGFRMPLAASLIAIRGYTAPDVEAQIERAREACDRIGPAAPRFHMLMVTWGHRFNQGRLADAGKLASGLVGLGEVADDDGFRCEAHWAAGCTAWWTGDFPAAWHHLERADLLYRIDAGRDHAAYTQQNCGPLLIAYGGLSLAMLGYPEKARDKIDLALVVADELRHPFTQAATLWAAGLHVELLGDATAALEFAERAIALSTAQSFSYWTALGLGSKGIALAQLGRDDEAMPLLIEAMARVEATGCTKRHQCHYAALAELHWRSGRRDEAWSALKHALAFNDRDVERYREAELYRLKAAFHAAESNEYEATVALVRAVEVARLQGARVFDLRATAALARLCAPTRPRDAREFLAPLVAAFPTDCTIPELRSARELLHSLSAKP